MKHTRHFLLLASFICMPLYADIPVVEDSSNFTANEVQDEPFLAGKPVKKVQDSESNWQEPLSQSEASSVESENATLLAKIGAMQQEIQELRGLLEVQAHDLKLLQQQQLAFYKDLDSRLSSNENNEKGALSLDSATPVATAKPAIESQPEIRAVAAKPQLAKKKNTDPADEQLSYVAAYEMIKNKQFEQAMTAMQTFVDDYPQSHYAANAHYWLGELYLLKRQFLFASKEFQQVLKDYPRSTKVAASMLKLGFVYAEMGNKPQAKKQFELVIQQFPDSSTAQLAKSKLTEISQS